MHHEAVIAEIGIEELIIGSAALVAARRICPRRGLPQGCPHLSGLTGGLPRLRFVRGGLRGLPVRSEIDPLAPSEMPRARPLAQSA